MDVLELPLSEWRHIAQESRNPALISFVNRLYDVNGRETLVLHPVDRDERDTGKQEAIVGDDAHRDVIEAMLGK